MRVSTYIPTKPITTPTRANPRPFSRPFDSLIFTSPTRPQIRAGPAATHKTSAAATLKIAAPIPAAVTIPQSALASVQKLHRGVGVSVVWGARAPGPWGTYGSASGSDGSTGGRAVQSGGGTGKDTDGSFWYRVASRA